MIDYCLLAESLKSPECDVLTDSPMKNQTTFKAGGNAKIIAFPKTRDALISAIRKTAESGAALILIGNGSNILVRDCGIDGVVIKTTAMEHEMRVDGTTVSCSAGTPLSRLCTAAEENALSGLEFAYGIPGTVGGAVFMNAGAYGGEISDVIKSVTHLTPSGDIQSLDARELCLGYRTSFYSQNPGYIILSAEFEARKGDKTEIRAKMDELIEKRREKQPLEYPSAGSTFKRPEGHFAGALIERCALKGVSVGGAQVSEKHAGFIINKGGTASDILTLMELVTRTVKEKTGVTLEPEVRIIP